MKPTTLLCMAMLLFLAACKNPKPDLSGLKDGTDTTKTDSAAPMDDGQMAEVDSAAMMKAWMDYATPGDMHKWMAKYDGTWTVDVTSWMSPDAPPMKSTATVTNKMILNGLYQISDYSGMMMGQDFLGHGILGYDNAKKEFVNTWIDNMGSGIVIMHGTLDPETNTLMLKGTQTNPLNGKDTMIRQEVKYLDDNNQMFTMWGEGMTGKEEKFMEAVSKRKM